MNNWKKNVRQVVPYVPGEQPQQTNVIKLNTNENPYPPSPSVVAKSKEVDTDRFALYPDPDAELLVNGLASYHKLKPEQVFVGVGSDDVLALSFLTFFNSDKPILFPDITYSFYPVWANLYQIPFENPAVDEEFRINIEDYKKENGGVVIANPNAPTSLALDISDLIQVVETNPDVVVIVDEAYIDFGGESMLPYIDNYDNLLVVRTYSKSRSMAGMRIGYAMGNPELIAAMKSVKESINSYTMNMESILLGAESLKDEEYFRDRVAQVVKTRDNTKESLRALGFTVLESSTNFLFVGHDNIPARYIFEYLRDRRVFVRYFSAPRVCDYLRISIGTDEQMEETIRLMKASIEEYQR